MVSAGHGVQNGLCWSCCTYLGGLYNVSDEVGENTAGEEGRGSSNAANAWKFPHSVIAMGCIMSSILSSILYSLVCMHVYPHWHRWCDIHAPHAHPHWHWHPHGRGISCCFSWEAHGIGGMVCCCSGHVSSRLDEHGYGVFSCCCSRSVAEGADTVGEFNCCCSPDAPDGGHPHCC